MLCEKYANEGKLLSAAKKSHGQETHHKK